jgi:hypothetical protein
MTTGDVKAAMLLVCMITVLGSLVTVEGNVLKCNIKRNTLIYIKIIIVLILDSNANNLWHFWQ